MREVERTEEMVANICIFEYCIRNSRIVLSIIRMPDVI